MDEAELAKYPGLSTRGGVWRVTKRVPRDLVHVEKREQIRLSLGTSDKREAIKRYPFKLAEIELGFDRLREKLNAGSKVAASLSVGKLERLSRSEIEGLVSQWWTARAAYRAPRLEPWENSVEVVTSIELDMTRLDDPEEGNPVHRLTDQLLVDAGMAAKPLKSGKIHTKSLSPSVDRNTNQYAFLTALVRQALELEAKLAVDYLEGRKRPSDDAFLDALSARSDPSGGASPAQVKDLIRRYRHERELVRGKESTDRKYGLLFRIMEEVLGPDLPARAISREHCVQIYAFLTKLPPNAEKRFPTLTLRQAAAKATAEGLVGLAPNTIGSYMQNLTAILRWAQRGGWGVQVDTAGLIESRQPQVQRRAFRPNELRKLFTALRAYRRSAPTRYWVPMLALFTGARANELCQLRPADVEDVHGIWCLNLTVFDDKGRRVEDKSLKTRASERYVPLHQTLLDLGFLEFVKGRHNEGLLFPDLKPGPKQTSYSQRFSKWFGYFKKRIGFDEPSLVFHSFRHGFRDACRDADIGEETALALGGWASIVQGQRYGNRNAVPNMNRAIQRLRFDGVEAVLPPPRSRERVG